MSIRTIAPGSSVDGLRKEAKRWLKALRANDADTPAALARLRAAVPNPPENPGLRDLQFALAREFGFAGWMALSEAVLAMQQPKVTEAADPKLIELLDAASKGDATCTAELLDAHPALVNQRAVLTERNGLRTALHFAVGAQSEAVVRLLLDRGADPNIRDEGDNAYPLHFAAEKGNLPIIRLLTEHGADMIGAGTMHELEILGWATCFGAADPAVVSYLLTHGAPHDICSAVATGDLDAIRAIVAANPAALSHRMDSANNLRRPLHLAVVKKKIEALELLLDLGADIEVTDASRMTPLDQAALAREQAMADLLIARGAEINLPTAIALNRREDAERLFRDNPDALKPGGKWDKLIIRASERASRKVIKALLKAGASPNIADDNATSIDTTPGYTPLHAAAFFGNSDAVDELMNHGADVRARDGRYCGTPAGWADYAGHKDIRNFILQGDIDLFQAIDFNLAHRIPGIVNRDPAAFDRPFSAYTTFDTELVDDRPDPATTPLEWAEQTGRSEAVRALRAHRDHAPDVHAARVDTFLRRACLDWRTGGSDRRFRMHEAARIHQHHPEIVHGNIYAAVAAGDFVEAERILSANPEQASEPGGPHHWPPILYLASARLPAPEASVRAVDIAGLLLDRGADPNSYYLGGNAKIHYTVFTCVMGRGEEQALIHPRAEALMRLLFERGAEPYDTQVMYNVFANHASRPKLADEIVWVLELMYERAIQLGRQADWTDPLWKMLDMGGYGPGAPYLLGAAADSHLQKLATWLTNHGAGVRPADAAPVDGAPVDGAAVDGVTDAQVPANAFASALFRLDRQAVAEQFAAHPEFVHDHRQIFEAVRLNRADVVELLLDHGVSPDTRDPNGGDDRVLHAAAYHGSVEAAQLLITRGAEIDFRESTYGGIPLGTASWANQSAMIELLGKYSRDIWELVYTGRVDRLRELIGADPALAKTTGSEGVTPLMWLPPDEAVALEIATLFVSNGADIRAVNKDGKTARDIAAEREMIEVVLYLEGAVRQG